MRKAGIFPLSVRISDMICFVGEGTARPGGKPPIRTGYRKNGRGPRFVIARRPTADVAISGRHSQFVPAAVKTLCTDCVCSGAHCAAVGGFAALRMRRALAGSDRLAGWQYLRYVFYGVRPPSLSFRGAKRRGNLAGPGWITGKFRQNRDCLPEIATAPSG